MRFRFKVSREVPLLPDPFWIENGLRGMFPARLFLIRHYFPIDKRL
jgi:hypothetical protein